MLKLIDIKKDYVTGDSTVHALRGVSLEFRESEFVSILGQSGCGKTTLLNIVGGLDQYTSGDLIINEKSTKQFKDRDWDTYRNHSVGFIFQSYNLIPHQTILANVELALTLSGVSKEERRKRATEALVTVGLGEQLKKRPNQLSGGQMQRVAIARALVNDPDILLADEPTGALDSETSVQIMELLKAISKEKLIVMVTHNPELAKEYSTRIINLLDGNVVSDSNPYVSADDISNAPRKKSINIEPSVDNSDKSEETSNENSGKVTSKNAKKGKTSMSFFTALSLSLNNLMTKKGRTFLTAFAGSIGIIGIALILSVSQGVNAYINSIEESTMASYPLEIHESSMDTMSLLSSLMKENTIENPKENTIYSNDVMANVMNSVTEGFTSNNLTAFKDFIEKDGVIKENSTDIKYVYTANLNTYVIQENNLTEPYRPTLNGIGELLAKIGLGKMFGGNSGSMSMGGSAFKELVGDDEYVKDQYDLLYGKYPTNANQVVLIVDSNHQISDFVLYTLGIRNTQDLENYIQSRMDDDPSNDYVIPSASFSYEDICGYKFKVVPDSEKFKIENGKIVPRSQKEIVDYLDSDKAMTLEVVGILTPSDSSNSSVIGAIGYTSPLMTKVINESNANELIKIQQENTLIDLLTGTPFAGYNPDCTYIRLFINDMIPDLASYATTMTDAQILQTIREFVISDEETASKLLSFESEGGLAPWGGYTVEHIDTIILPTINEIKDERVKGFAFMLYQYSMMGYPTADGSSVGGDPTRANFIKVLNSMLTDSEGYTPAQAHLNALNKIGYIDLDKPNSILIYPKDFDAKDVIKASIEQYNEEQIKDDKITYTDTVAMLMSSVTTIVNAISYVLIAFVAISLVVSSIMIGIITYISVLERTKEIGILRSIGASKKDVSRVFSAETLIVGFVAGVIGIVVSLLLIIVINIILNALTGIPELKAALPWAASITLVLISMALTLIAGIFPSRIAATKDPVIALRTE